MSIGAENGYTFSMVNNAEEGEVGGGEAARAGGAHDYARGGHASQVTN